MSRPRIAAAILLLVATGALAVGLACRPLQARGAHPDWRAAQVAGGALVLRDGLAVAEFSGDPAERGRAHGQLVGRQASELLAIMGFTPTTTLAGQRLRGCLAAVRPEDRAEIAALAAASGLPVERLLEANATVESMCSAVVRLPPGGPVRVARNMDFFPPSVLGPSTLLQVVRAPGRHAYAAVGWPGMVGVISGMNDAGLAACILLNWRGAKLPPAEPLPFRVRRLLMDCGDVDAGLAVLAAAPVGSPHYVLLADRAGAALAWWTADGLHVDRPNDGWLVATNLPHGADSRPLGVDLRCACLRRAIDHLAGGEPGVDWFRSAVTASFMPIDNAQAMVFVPAERRLDLALAEGLTAAAKRPWRALALGPVLDGAAVATLAVDDEPPARRLHHYLLGGAD